MILLFLFFYDLREEGRRKESGDEKEYNSAQQKIGTCPGGMHVILSSLKAGIISPCQQAARGAISPKS